jgi:hypothetical protein
MYVQISLFGSWDLIDRGSVIPIHVRSHAGLMKLSHRAQVVPVIDIHDPCRSDRVKLAFFILATFHVNYTTIATHHYI